MVLVVVVVAVKNTIKLNIKYIIIFIKYIKLNILIKKLKRLLMTDENITDWWENISENCRAHHYLHVSSTDPSGAGVQDVRNLVPEPTQISHPSPPFSRSSSTIQLTPSSSAHHPHLTLPSSLVPFHCGGLSPPPPFSAAALTGQHHH